MIVFGPVPSRRLGQSLGINNVFKKHCSYSCIYCQLGRTPNKEITRRTFYKPTKIQELVSQQVHDLTEKKEPIDYITFVSEGEPTLDKNIGKALVLLKDLQIPTAVITNASLLWKQEVQKNLLQADCVCIKIDAVTAPIWKKINQPHPALNLEQIIQGITNFSEQYPGRLLTDTMLIHNLNDQPKEVKNIASFIKTLTFEKSFLSLPIRPPAEKSTLPATKTSLQRALKIFKEKGIQATALSDYEGTSLAYLKDIEKEILSIASVHPIREEGIQKLLSKAQADWSVVEKLIKKGQLKETIYHKKRFYSTVHNKKK